MNEDRDLDRLVVDHLNSSARRMPDHFIGDVLERIPDQPQERPPSVWVRRVNRSLIALGTAAAVIAALVIGPSLVGRLATGPAGLPSPTPQHQWHRDNFGASHERLTCDEATQVWTCSYEDAAKPEPLGRFNGVNVTDSWSCPGWFAAAICDPNNLVAVYEGIGTIFPGESEGAPARIPQEYVLTKINGQEILYLYWLESDLGTFYCPWFRTYQEALDAAPECTSLPQ